MKILALDTATEIASCAIIQEDKILGEINISFKNQHSVVLLPLINYLLESLNLTINDMDGYVVAMGPGSFTGLRIGVACVKGLSQGTNKPFTAISTLDSLAYNLAFNDGIICPILDALRDNVYTALYRFEDNKLNRLTDYMVLSIEELGVLLNKEDSVVHFIGDGSIKYKNALLDLPLKFSIAPPSLNVVRASSLGELGLLNLKVGKCEDLFTFAPIYLRKSSAERELERKAGL
ncbi:MAG TPA: tRNA (adenosine(37)-N6)-threonylcarbamoyltransferase complex dimerization subunit type 1 TsaB [Clostridiaceae bacterium]